MRVDVVIVGGGLSGLHTAWQLQSMGLTYALVEKRDRLGGRILSPDHHGQSCVDTFSRFDLGPAWFWPGQNHLAQLIESLELTDAVFEQWARGDSLYEDAQGQLHRGMSGISMAGSWRLEGGMARLTSTLLSRLENNNILLNSTVVQIQQNSDHLTTYINTDDKQTLVESRYVVLALPPRIVSSSIAFEPALSPKRTAALQDTPTWMAGHAKLIAVYRHSFWRQQELSGDVISHCGPLHEIHDASSRSALAQGAGDEDTGHALFGFVGVAPNNRDSALSERAIQQLIRLFGEDAKDPVAVLYKDWSRDAATSTDLDQQLMTEHALPPMASMAARSWNGRLLWAGSESASGAMNINGYLEGAISASQRCLDLIDDNIHQG